ncbi:hypothetical protein B7G54_36395 [Burkholderia puraquae]|uniref:Uncharacterized protein n=1 Tax=Burkholderia puraquae TaxID=1904757 RepID=A0A1X1P618_9BURK|nr:hypothetical protein B7G54_36395 [Burkholderia puraquae]
MSATPNTRPIRAILRAGHAGLTANCIPAIRARLCPCRKNPADYPHEEARHAPCAATSARARPTGDAPPLTSCRQTNRS